MKPRKMPLILRRKLGAGISRGLPAAADRKRPPLLAFAGSAADIGTGRLAVDEPLANRVRSGRKQP